MKDVFKLSVDWSKPCLSVSTSWWALGLVVLIIVGLWAVKHRYFRRNQYILENITVEIPLPGGKISGVLKPDESQRKAAWELYVELVTRISVVELLPDEGLLREALSSLYSLFGTTRQILRQHGASVSRPRKGDAVSVGYVAVSVLNKGLRPVLAKWHPLLQEHEAVKDPKVSVKEHEVKWPHHSEMRQALEELRNGLTQYAKVLEEVAGIPSTLIVERGNK